MDIFSLNKIIIFISIYLSICILVHLFTILFTIKKIFDFIYNVIYFRHTFNITYINILDLMIYFSWFYSQKLLHGFYNPGIVRVLLKTLGLYFDAILSNIYIAHHHYVSVRSDSGLVFVVNGILILQIGLSFVCKRSQ